MLFRQIQSVSDTKPRTTHRVDVQHARSATAVAVHCFGVSHRQTNEFGSRERTYPPTLREM
eukprot:770282-Pleurochrysis_carterae.AAC.1